MTRRRTALTVTWLALALATLIILIAQGDLLLWGVAFLAWLGGIVTQRLYDDTQRRTTSGR